MKNILKYLCVFVIVLVSVTIIDILIPKNLSLYVENAMVNEANGDIAVTYHQNNEDGSYTIDLYLFDSAGNLLFVKKHESDGGSHSIITFVEDKIYIYASRANYSYGYDRNGNNVSPLSREDWENYDSNEWVGWEKSRGEKTYTWGNNIYRYSFIPYPRSTVEFGCSISIENTETQECVTLLEFK